MNCIKNHTQTTEPTTTERLIVLTCISSTHVHVCYLLPGVCPWVVDFDTFPHQGPVMAPSGVEQPAEHTDTCQAQPGQTQHRDRAAHPCSPTGHGFGLSKALPKTWATCASRSPGTWSTLHPPIPWHYSSLHSNAWQMSLLRKLSGYPRSAV